MGVGNRRSVLSEQSPCANFHLPIFSFIIYYSFIIIQEHNKYGRGQTYDLSDSIGAKLEEAPKPSVENTKTRIYVVCYMVHLYALRPWNYAFQSININITLSYFIEFMHFHYCWKMSIVVRILQLNSCAHATCTQLIIYYPVEKFEVSAMSLVWAGET